MNKCIFCEIAAKRLQTAAVYEDADFAAFLDVNPLNKGHTLVVPKQHVRWTYEVEKFGDYWEVAKAVALAAINSLGAETVNFVTMSMGVQHAAIHMIPRYKDDGHGELPMPGNVKQISKEEMQSIAAKLADAVARNPPKKSAATWAPKAEQPGRSMEEELEEEQVELIRREFESG